MLLLLLLVKKKYCRITETHVFFCFFFMKRADEAASDSQILLVSLLCPDQTEKCSYIQQSTSTISKSVKVYRLFSSSSIS
jgi:hypothetical protein